GKASSTGGLVGVFLMGLTLVITSFTCTAPFVGSLLASGAQQGAMHTALGMGVFGLTMATPFVLLSLFPSRLKSMPNAGAWMNTLKVFLGFVELAASLKFLSTADLAWGWEFISKEVFLLAWGSIFLVAAAFLFGWINLKGEEDGAISPGRLVGATATFVFGMYSLFLIGGYKMDPLMLAFAPPYSTAPERAAGESGSKSHPIVKDDYEDAVSQAKDKQKALLVNFTGFN
ncbi:MAG: thiol:disulfide interchange protein, partial [Planctomycetota bacterium]